MFPIRDHNPSGSTPYVTYALIALNAAVFVLTWLGMGEEQAAWFAMDWGMVPARVTAGGGWETILTSMFLHGGWMHLLGNMLFLYIFGDNLEDVMGHGRYLGFYLLSGAAAAGLQVLADPASPVPMIGASGAISGVMGGYLLLFPRAKVDILLIFVIFFRIFSVPAWVMLGLWFGAQVLFGLSTHSEAGGVAYWAHAGGFIAGILLAWPFWRALGGRAYWQHHDGEPPHPAAVYPLSKTSIPRVVRRK